MPFQTADIDSALSLARALEPLVLNGGASESHAALFAAIGAWLDSEEVATRMDARQCLDADFLFPASEED